jgi:acyl carrier protein
MNDIYPKVVTILVDALNVEPHEITMNSTLKNDLGAESIDVLDMIFRLERTFDIKITTDEMFPRGAAAFEAFTVGHIVEYIKNARSLS